MSLLSTLERYLPPPQFLTMPSLGVDISDTSLKYIAFKPTTDTTGDRTLTAWGDIAIPQGAVAQGEIKDPKQLVAVLKEFKEQTKAEFIRVSLPEERAYLFETEIKKTTPIKEVRSLLEFRLEENVPIPSREAFFDYTILPVSPESKTAQVSVVAYAKETIQTYYDACIEAGLRPISFEVEAQAMARAVIPKANTHASLLVDFGKTRTGIGIVYRGTLLYTSTIDIGGNELSRVLRKVLGDTTAESELTRIKNTEGLLRGVDSSEVTDALLSTISVIKDEIVTRMQYWHMRIGADTERRITTVVLCGGSANLNGLPEYLTETIGIPTYRGNVWENAFSIERTIPPIDLRHSFGYASAIGLALKTVV